MRPRKHIRVVKSVRQRPGRFRGTESALVGIAPDEYTAREWQQVLDQAGIESEVRYDLRLSSLEVPSPMPYLVSPGASMWSYPVEVRRQDQRKAQKILGLHREEARAVNALASAPGALAFVTAVLLLVALLVRFRE